MPTTDGEQLDMLGDVPEKAKAPLMDAKEAIRLRDEGMAKVAVKNADWLDVARRIAVSHVKFSGHDEITADDLRRLLAFRGIPGPSHFNAWGSVFRGDPRFEPTGDWRQSSVPVGHGNWQRVWRLKK